MRSLRSPQRYLRRYTPGHRVQLLHNGAETFPSMLEAIRNAQNTICLETYILRADQTGERFAQALIERAQKGVEVNLMFDAVGSLGLINSFLHRLRQGGVRVTEYGPIRWYTLPQLNRRNHRKTLVVDGKVGFIGGINIADEYAPSEEGGGGWRDTHLRIEGPAVCQLEKIFLQTWQRADGVPVNEELYGKQCANVGDVLVRIISNRLFQDRLKIRTAYLRAIKLAQKRICITNAYFLPDPIFIRALAKAAKRGVQVDVILGGRTSDVPWVGYAGHAIFGKLLKKGIHLHEWQDRVLHAKTAVVDEAWSTIGSYNLDYRSLLHNLEANAGIADTEFGFEMEALFDLDLSKSRPITLEEWESRSFWEKLRDWITYRFRFLL